MINIKQELNGDILTITIDLSERHGKSASGKTNRIASSLGNKKVDGTDFIIGINCYEKIEGK